jgi:hypothetical protein
VSYRIAADHIELLNQMLEGGLYMNIHTSNHPWGNKRQVYKLAEPYSFDRTVARKFHQTIVLLPVQEWLPLIK